MDPDCWIFSCYGLNLFHFHCRVLPHTSRPTVTTVASCYELWLNVQLSHEWLVSLPGETEPAGTIPSQVSNVLNSPSLALLCGQHWVSWVKLKTEFPSWEEVGTLLLPSQITTHMLEIGMWLYRDFCLFVKFPRHTDLPLSTTKVCLLVHQGWWRGA